MLGAGGSNTARCMLCRLAAPKVPNVTKTPKNNSECRNTDAPRKNNPPVQRAKIAHHIHIKNSVTTCLVFWFGMCRRGLNFAFITLL